MSKSEKKAPPKKVPPKKKYPGIWGVWFEFNFVKGAPPHPGNTRGEIESYYRKFLAKWDHDNNVIPPHAIRFTWSILSGTPEIHHLIGEISPAPVEIPHPPPQGGTTTPPSPPPPPPPSLS